MALFDIKYEHNISCGRCHNRIIYSTLCITAEVLEKNCKQTTISIVVVTFAVVIKQKILKNK